ncbi:MAG: S-layer homology domain-containing protein [Candidatus Pristimantibacillus sp.]
MKKTYLMILSLSLVFTLFSSISNSNHSTAQAAAAPNFKDISNHWAKSSIDTAVKANILNGYPDGTFKPENSITRAELLKVMALTAKLNVGAAPAGKPWYTPYQTALTSSKVYASGDFSGDINKAITRVEMAKLAIRTVEVDYRGKKLSNDELMFRAVNAGLLSRTGTKAETIDPKGTTTRAQAAVLVARLLKLQNGDKLTVDQGASSAAEITWHRHNMITMFDQDDLVKFPYTVKADSKYELTFDKLIILDPDDKSGYLNEYLTGAKYYLDGKKANSSEGYVFAYKLKGENLVVANENRSISNLFYMLANFGESGDFFLADKYNYWDMKVSERIGLFTNRTGHALFNKKNDVGHNFRFEFITKDFIHSQIKKYGGYPIHLEWFKAVNGKTEFFLTDVKD